MNGPGSSVNIEIDDLDEAADWYSKLYPGLRLVPAAKPAPFRLHVRGAAWSDLAAMRLQLSSRVQALDAEEGENFTAFQIVGGTYRYERGDADYRGRTGDLIMFPNDPKPVITGNNGDHRMVMVNRRIMLDVAAELGAESLAFTGFHPTNPAAARGFSRVLAYAERVALDEDPVCELAVNSLARHIAHMMVATWANTAYDPRPAPQRGPGTARHATLLAVEHINAHFLEPITVAEIAAAARVKPRVLYTLFRKRFDMTPMDYVRQARLSWAHSQFEGADPKSVKISAIARKAGWTSISNFAVAYRKMYGRLPSETLYKELHDESRTWL